MGQASTNLQLDRPTWAVDAAVCRKEFSSSPVFLKASGAVGFLFSKKKSLQVSILDTGEVDTHKYCDKGVFSKNTSRLWNPAKTPRTPRHRAIAAVARGCGPRTEAPFCFEGKAEWGQGLAGAHSCSELESAQSP